MPANSSPLLTLKLLCFQPSLQSPARTMYRVLTIATLLLLAPLTSGEAEDQAPTPAVQSKRSDSPAASPPTNSPASASGASSPAPATSPSTAPASSPFVGSVVPELQRPPSPPMPSAGESPVEAPGPNVADEKSGSVRNGAGLVLGGAMAAWMALGAAF